VGDDLAATRVERVRRPRLQCESSLSSERFLCSS
jgi:hypothetical protein